MARRLHPQEPYGQIADLRTQLREAQEERDAAEETVGRQNDQWTGIVRGLEQQLDAAIERGVCAINYLEAYDELLGLVRQQLIGEHNRAEAAERDAEAQRAMVEELAILVKRGKHLLALSLSSVGRESLRAGIHDHLASYPTPAEALRARSPQGGQKEGD